MKIVCINEKLKETLEYAERVIGKTLTLPILNNLLLKVEKNGLKVVSTNLELAVISWFPCKVLKEGEITVPARILYGMVSNISADKTNLEVKKDNILTVTTTNYKAELKGESSKDFPIIPKVKADMQFEVKAADLCKAIDQVISFVSNSETRPEITGLLIQKDKNQNELKIVSTDSFRLGEKIITLDTSFKELQFSVIIPQRTAGEVLRIFSNKDGNLRIMVEKNQISFELNKTEIISRLIEGNYPDYKQLIPQEFKTEAVLDREELSKTIKLISLFSSRVNDIKLSISPGQESNLKIFAGDPELGENSANVDSEARGGQLEISFNWKYLSDGISAVVSPKIKLSFVDNSKPCLIRSPQDKTFLYLVMPIRI